LSKPKPLPKRVYLLGWISLFADVASEMVYPIIPIYATAVLMAQPTALGMIEGVAAAIVSFMRGWSGWHSDRAGKRVPYIRWGYGLSPLGKPMLALPAGWIGLLAARSVDRLGKGLRSTARDALIADSVDKSQYGQAFGLHRSMDTGGAFLGGVLAILMLIVWPGDLKGIFLVAFLPGLASVAITFLVKEPTKEAFDVPNPESMPLERLRLRSFSPAFWRAVVIATVFGLANSSDTFLLLKANEVFIGIAGFDWLRGLLPKAAVDAHFPLILTTMAYLLYNIAYVALSYPAGLVSDRLGRWGVIGVGWTLYAAVYAGFAFAGGGSIWWLFLLYGVYIGLADGVGKALVADHAPPERRGTALGVYFMALGFATILGNLAMGWIWSAHSPTAAFLTGSGLAVFAVLLIPLTSFVAARKS
jgi:MFS family permease